MIANQVAAVWWRVSGEEQREISPQTQITEAKALAEREGYQVPDDFIIGTDWHSLSVWESPPMDKLKGLIRSRAIGAVFMYDADRGPSKPAHRLLLRAMCQEHGVLIRCRYGQVPEGDMCEIMEFLSAWQKEKQVLRAQQGAKDGLRDRARLKHLPAVPKKPYGYVWDNTRTKLAPTSDWPNAELICRLALDGMPIRAMVRELHRRGIPSPQRREWWVPATIHWIITNPVYAGRYYALRQTSVEPQHRQAQSYGKSSHRVNSLAESFHLDNIKVEHPPLIWDEWLVLQDRLKANKLQAKRNGKRDYLLRSHIICDTHRRRYAGGVKGNRCIYACSTRVDPGHQPCARPRLPGRALEEQIKGLCQKILESPDIIEQQIRSRTGTVESTKDTIRKSLVALDRKNTGNLDTETNLALEKARGNVSPEAYERALARVRAERTWITEERRRLDAQLKSLEQGHAALLGLAQVREQLAQKLGNATNEDWRMIFNALGVEVHVDEHGEIETSVAIPMEMGPIVSNTPGDTCDKSIGCSHCPLLEVQVSSLDWG